LAVGCLLLTGGSKKLKLRELFVASLMRLYARLLKQGFDIIPAGLPELILSAFCKKDFAGLYNNL